MSAELDKRVDQYVRLRDKIKEIKDRHAEELKPYNECLEKLGLLLLGELQTAGAESMKTGKGTFYRRTVTSVSVNDPKAFREFVLENGAWNLADVRANKVGVDGYVSQEGEAPPGVNYSQFVDIGVRRPSSNNSEE